MSNRHHVEVSQLRPQGTDQYLNVITGWDHIGVWSVNHDCCMMLFTRRNHVFFMVFENAESAVLWCQEHPENWDRAFQFVNGEPVEVPQIVYNKTGYLHFHQDIVRW